MLLELNVLELNGLSIFEQLQLEEALLRTGSDNWLILNTGAPPAIVMGISGKSELLIESSAYQSIPIPVIRRYSGGGTVVIDPETVFVTLISKTLFLQGSSLSPEKIMKWSGAVYGTVFDHPEFSLKENDYTIGDKKCGGNAQYLCKDRFVHHTSFLWDFSAERLKLLKHPPKTPAYREGRSHLDFLTPLKGHFSSKSEFFKKIKGGFAHHYSLKEGCLKTAKRHMQTPHRQATQFVDLA